MSGLSILLLAALVLLGAWHWRICRGSRTAIAALARLTGADAPTFGALSARFEALQADRQELARQEYLRRLFESLLNEIHQGVIIVDNDLVVRFANRATASLFNRPAIERLQPLLEQLHDHQVVETARAAIADGRRTIRQIRFIQAGSSGAGRHYLVEAAPLPAEAERGAWIMVHDITEQIQTEQIRKDFVANASHELRTPLTLIQGYIETLKSGLIEDSAAAMRSLDVMDKHGKRIIRIIEDMLTISKLEDSNATLALAPFNLRACVQDAIDHLPPVQDHDQVRFDLDLPADGGAFQGDRFYWDQIFTNLIENAIKENRNRRIVIRVSARLANGLWTIQLSDNGVGIPAHDVPFVFKRFYRGHKHHAQNVVKGTGLGLSIVRRAVEAHGGSIELRSTPGVETVFTMTVPAKTA
jgi:two-component system phosphate regulon sensor histidine kinase PhoR